MRGSKVRRVIGILLASSISAASLAEAGDELVMPYDCGLQGGRVTLSPTAERHYAIVGEREKQAITTCRSQTGGCRTLTVHRFVISCAGAGVSWMRVAAAIRRATDTPAWIEGGRLNLVLPEGRSAAAKPPCMERAAFGLGGPGLERRVAYAGHCSMSPQHVAYDQVILPAGFAPVSELGARLVLADAQAPLSPPRMRGPNGRVSRVSAAVGETFVAKAESDAIVDPIPGLEPYEPVLDPAAADNRWVTVVRTEPAPAPAAARGGSGGAPAPWALFLTIMALASAVGLVRTRLANAGDGRRMVPSSQLVRSLVELWPGERWGLGRAAPVRTNAGAAVAALLEQTVAIVADLKGAGPLREVLQSELKLVRQRLAGIEAGAGGEEEAAKSGPYYRALVRELERIRRIAHSAAASLLRARHATDLPRTTAEAYDVLGINPDVSEDVLKKIVDALRMSWHPDHARGSEDRGEREVRIRQINVAWELITAKREAA